MEQTDNINNFQPVKSMIERYGNMEYTDTQNKIIEICDGIKELLLEKNKRYGDAALNPDKIFSKLDASEGIRIRLNDKIARIKNSIEPKLAINDLSDIQGYLVLLMISYNYTKEEILKLID